ncbi:unnamed protein product [marine sediment metagenome]|uniref:DNA binding HTH domain-containing protein n=1 Tax=marine sediment metagenome TaxID=412755 RepID=X1LLM1_9ZZZZ
MSGKKKEIDWNVVNDLLSNSCNGFEIAKHLGISFNTLRNQVKQKFNCGFREYKRKKRAQYQTL